MARRSHSERRPLPRGPRSTAIPCGARCAILLLLCKAGSAAKEQELEPRAYSPNPVGANFLLTSYARSTGDVLVDASLPLRDIEARLNTGVIGYGRTFALFDRSASAGVVIPYVWGDVSGNVAEASREVSRTGLADPRLRLSVNLIGGEALTPAQFAVRTPRTSLGASLQIIVPAGEYDSSKLINLGANRWAFKPELGVSHPMGPWYWEAYAGVWFFTANESFFGGVRREQDPIATAQAHVSYTFGPQLWVAADSTYYRGGQTSIDGRGNADLQSNGRFGVTFSVPIGPRQSIKFSWSDGVATRIGGDFTTYGITWQYAWFD